jgi:hypothetical protein
MIYNIITLRHITLHHIEDVPAHQPLHILCNRVTVEDGKPSLRVRIRCDDMELAADLVQDIAR